MGEPVLVHEILGRSAERMPDRPFLVLPDRTVTYAQAERRSNQMGRLLRRLGVERGDRVAVLSESTDDYVTAYYGALKAGAVAVPVNTSTDGRGLNYILDNCDVKALVTQNGFSEVVTAALPTAPRLRLLVTDGLESFGTIPAHLSAVEAGPAAAAESEEPPAAGGIDVDLASIIYTSGSTGRPRGAMLSHLNLVSNTRSIVQYLGLTPEDRVLAVLPFYYVYGKSLLNTHAWAGGSLVLGTDLAFPNDVVTEMHRTECTGFSGVPSTFAILLNRSRLSADPPPSLRYVTQAGGAMAPEMIRRLMEALPRTRIFIMYGATEAGARLTYLSPDDLPRKIGSIGRAIPNVEVRVLKEDGTEAATGETGELVARGSNIMSGYWSDLEETRQVLGPEGFHTGDLGRRDEDGFLYVVGRKREMIKCGAHRISPKEIEEALMEHPDVHEAAVIGVPHEILGEAIRAFVVLREGSALTARELEGFAAARLPEYKVPAEILLRTDLPKNASGKIQKQKLRAT